MLIVSYSDSNIFRNKSIHLVRPLSSPLCKKERFPNEGGQLAASVICVYITEPYTAASASYTKPEMVQEDTRWARQRPAAATLSQALIQSEPCEKMDLRVGSARLAFPIMTPRSAQHPFPTESKFNSCGCSFLKLPRPFFHLHPPVVP